MSGDQTRIPPDWSLLPEELVEIISKKIACISDYIRFRAVCKPWRSASPRLPGHLPPQLPWLMLPYDPQPSLSLPRGFFDVVTGKTHYLNLPETHGKRCHGSSHGWLMLEQGRLISLLNPITRAQIDLPPLENPMRRLITPPSMVLGDEYTLQESSPNGYRFVKRGNRFINKVILSANPSLDPGCIVMAILQYNSNLAFCKAGDGLWTVIQSDIDTLYIDAIYQSGRFYSINFDGRIIVYDVDRLPASVRVIPSPLHDGGDQKFFVERSPERLLMVVWNFNVRNLARKAEYSVFELGLDDQWFEVKDIGDNALFFGGGHCFAVSTRDFHGWRGSRIYYTYPFYLQMLTEGDLASHGMRVFNLEDGNVAPLEGNLGMFSLEWPSPIWITPSLF